MNLPKVISTAAIGYPSAIIAAKALAHFGHHFIQMSHQTILTIGAIGVVHNLVALILENQFKADKNDSSAILKGHVVAGLALYTLSALAVRVDLIAASLTLYGTGALIISGLAGTLLVNAAIGCTKENLRERTV